MTPDELAYLTVALENATPYPEIAAHLGVCVDTLKRILMREDLAYFDSAKYVLPQAEVVRQEMWERPCSNCGSTKPRPKWHFRCASCKSHEVSGRLDECNIKI